MKTFVREEPWRDQVKTETGRVVERLAMRSNRDRR